MIFDEFVCAQGESKIPKDKIEDILAKIYEVGNTGYVVTHEEILNILSKHKAEIGTCQSEQ